jgi:CBS domain-containing protein
MVQRNIAEMIRDKRPLSMPPDATIAEACAALHKRRVGAVLVTEPGGQLAGIFTGRDAVRCIAEGRDAHHTKLRDVMTPNPVTLTPEQSASDALRLLNHGGFRHLPICRDGMVVGIVSRYDFRTMEEARLENETGFFERMR